MVAAAARRGQDPTWSRIIQTLLLPGPLKGGGPRHRNAETARRRSKNTTDINNGIKLGRTRNGRAVIVRRSVMKIRNDPKNRQVVQAQKVGRYSNEKRSVGTPGNVAVGFAVMTCFRIKRVLIINSALNKTRMKRIVPSSLTTLSTLSHCYLVFLNY